MEIDKRKSINCGINIDYLFNCLFSDFRYMLYLALSAKLCSTIFFCGAWLSYLPPKHIQQNNGQSNINPEDAQEQEAIIYNNNRLNPIDDNF